MVAKQSRREGVYNRTGDLSVTCFGKEEQRNECEAIKNRRKRYIACDDVARCKGLGSLRSLLCLLRKLSDYRLLLSRLRLAKDFGGSNPFLIFL